MLYDWNPKHAAEAYDGNTYDWIRQTYKRLEGKDADADTLTDKDKLLASCRFTVF